MDSVVEQLFDVIVCWLGVKLVVILEERACTGPYMFPRFQGARRMTTV
jgi:hypothetical protein